MSEYFNKLLEFFPDRLSEPKWKDHCRIEGLEHLHLAMRNGRPVILTFSHFGPFTALRFWLRAMGIPAATLIAGKSAYRDRLKRLRDTFSQIKDSPIAFYQDELREMTRFIATGKPLLIATDATYGKQMLVPFCEGWHFRMATGAVRLAISHHAELIPCYIVEEGHWQYKIVFRPPVPREFLAEEADWTLAGKHLLDELTKTFLSLPRQNCRDLISCFKQSTAATGTTSRVSADNQGSKDS